MNLIHKSVQVSSIVRNSQKNIRNTFLFLCNFRFNEIVKLKRKLRTEIRIKLNEIKNSILKRKGIIRSLVATIAILLVTAHEFV